jgi:FtsH-binding integral membrane protein
MNNFNQDKQFADYQVVGSTVQPVTKTFMASVFLWMFAALAISAFFALWFASNAELIGSLYTGNKLNGLGMLVTFSPIGFVLLMSLGYNKLSAPLMGILFVIFAAIMGISLSSVLLIYTSGSVFGCFLTASLMFGVMAVLGYTTKQDLTSFGRILFMGLIGIIIASLVNMFLRSPFMDYIISFIGVAVFTGLTAYDVQKLKQIGAGTYGISANDTKKMSIFGALTLYLDFINLFLMLLRLFGKRK